MSIKLNKTKNVMQVIELKNKENEVTIGFVTPTENVDFPNFYNAVLTTFESLVDTDIEIEDFVDTHNANNELKIDWVICETIEL